MQYTLTEEEYNNLIQYKKAIEDKTEVYGTNGVFMHHMLGQSRSVKLFVNREEAIKILFDEMNSWKTECDRLRKELSICQAKEKPKNSWF